MTPDRNTYRCRDSSETREFYEDFLGLPLVKAFEIDVTKSGREAKVLNSCYEMEDGSCLAFFEEPGKPFDFKPQPDFDLHIALEVDHDTLERMFKAGKAAGMETRGVSDHGFIRSIYFRDPDDYVIELTERTNDGDETPATRRREPPWRSSRGRPQSPADPFDNRTRGLADYECWRATAPGLRSPPKIRIIVYMPAKVAT